MMKHTCILLLLFFFSCKESVEDRTVRLVREWDGKQIRFSQQMKFISFNGDSVNTYEILNDEYSIVSYIDSTGCTSCKLQLPAWKQFLLELDSISNNTVPCLFFFHPKNTKDLIFLLKRVHFVYPVCIDENDSFNKLNHFPTDMMFQTFLLDKDSKVIAMGNPVHNPKVKKLYLKIIMGDKAPKETARMQTTIACPIATLDMGEFDWQQEQTGSFELTNTGNHPLVIIDAVTSCGCTSVVYDKAPIPPGKSTELKVRYKADHPEHFNKTITVHCNAETSPVKLSIKGNAQ